MPRRTSAYEVLAKYWVLAFILTLPFGLPAVLAGVITLPFLAFIALVVTLFFNGLQWLGHRLIFWGLFGEDEEYKQYRKNGGDPWYPRCPSCQQRMVFISQLSNEDYEVAEGIYYAFVCRDCQTAATHYQQT